MDEVMEALKSIDWDGLGKILSDYVASLDIPGFFADLVQFVKDLVSAIIGGEVVE